MSLLEPDIEAAPWESQAAADDPLYRRQIAHLLERSPFYRDKLTQAGFGSAERIGGLKDIARLPFTEKDELRASRSAERPMGSHVTAANDDIARIYSTSGTTGAPSYIPLTAADLEVWVRTSARSYAASGLQRGDRLVSTYNAGPFVAGATLDAFARLGLCVIPVGSGNTDRLIGAVERLRPSVVALTPSYALHLAEWAESRGIDLAKSSVKRLMVAGEPGGGRSGDRAPSLEAAWGRPRSPRRWASATSRPRYGANARPRTECISPVVASCISNSSTRQAARPLRSVMAQRVNLS